ncbi:MAG: hypothetical protein WCV67_18585 [Victivallaceae bacterium]
MGNSNSKKKVPVNILYSDAELKKLDKLVDRDKSTRPAVVRKATEMLHIVTFEKPELYSKIFEEIT